MSLLLQIIKIDAPAVDGLLAFSFAAAVYDGCERMGSNSIKGEVKKVDDFLGAIMGYSLKSLRRIPYHYVLLGKVPAIIHKHDDGWYSLRTETYESPQSFLFGIRTRGSVNEVFDFAMKWHFIAGEMLIEISKLFGLSLYFFPHHFQKGSFGKSQSLGIMSSKINGSVQFIHSQKKK